MSMRHLGTKDLMCVLHAPLRQLSESLVLHRDVRHLRYLARVSIVVVNIVFALTLSAIKSYHGQYRDGALAPHHHNASH